MVTIENISVRRNEQVKVEALYKQYQKLMFVVAKRILQDDYLAEDAVHEAFIKIMRYLDKIEQVNSVKTKGLMILVVERMSIDLYRKKKKANECVLEDMEEKMYYTANDGSTNDEEALHILDGLPKKYAEVISLKYYYGYKTREISNILGINENTVRTNMARGKKILNELMMNKRGARL